MKTIGIVAEYNPFHSGHLYQIEYLKNLYDCNIVIAQSGSCTQRGEIALFSKFNRAKTAVNNGADLVLEIPFPYSSLSAEGFCFAGVNLLKEVGVDAICFGSESANINLLKDIAKFLLSDEYNNLLKKYLNEKLPFAKARQKAILEKFKNSKDIISSSNDILAIEYIKSALILNWDCDFIPIKRKGALYNDLKGKDGTASATMIRNSIAIKDVKEILDYIPKNASDVFLSCIKNKEYFIFDKSFEKSLLFTLKTKDVEYFKKVSECNEELSFAFFKALKTAVSVKELFSLLPTKTYTKARLRRIMLFAFLEVFDNFFNTVPYIRILASSDEGLTIVKEATKTTLLPISHSIKKIQQENEACRLIAEYEHRAFTAFSSFCKKPISKSLDFTTPMYKK